MAVVGRLKPITAAMAVGSVLIAADWQAFVQAGRARFVLESAAGSWQSVAALFAYLERVPEAAAAPASAVAVVAAASGPAEPQALLLLLVVDRVAPRPCALVC